MNTVQNGKGDSPRNNCGQRWYSGYAAIDWRGRRCTPGRGIASTTQSLAAARTSMNSRNPDGDFGESSLACLDDGQRGRGTTTRTQPVRVFEFDQTT